MTTTMTSSNWPNLGTAPPLAEAKTIRRSRANDRDSKGKSDWYIFDWIEGGGDRGLFVPQMSYTALATRVDPEWISYKPIDHHLRCSLAASFPSSLRDELNELCFRPRGQSDLLFLKLSRESEGFVDQETKRESHSCEHDRGDVRRLKKEFEEDRSACERIFFRRTCISP